jgi:hypothetical protein
VGAKLASGFHPTDEDLSVGTPVLQPLSPGKYGMSVWLIGSYRPDSSVVDLNPGACWDLTLDRVPHAQIGGHLRRFDGAPVPSVDVALISSDNTWYQTTQTDHNGYFHFFYQHDPGEYVLGLNFPGRPDWINGSAAGAGIKIPPVSLYYPGVANRPNACIIRLKDDEKLDNLDFTLPVQ